MTSSAERTPISVDPGRLRLDDSAEAGGVLLGMRCLDCDICVFGQAVFCQACTGSRLEPVDLSQTGTLYSFTVVRVPPEGWPGPVPYILGEVELAEGPHILAEVIDVPEDDLRIGLRVQLALRSVQSGDSRPDRMVYKWEPAKHISGNTSEE